MVLTIDVMRKLGAARVLDYGGGDGTMAAALRAQGLDAQSWDPIADGDGAAPTAGAFDLVTAFEVFEHTATPLQTASHALSMLRPNGRLFFSTLLMDGLPSHATDH